MEIPDAPLSNVELPIFSTFSMYCTKCHAFLLQVVPVHEKKYEYFSSLVTKVSALLKHQQALYVYK